MGRTDDHICALHGCFPPHFRIIAIRTDDNAKFCTFRSVTYGTAASRNGTLKRNPRIHFIIAVNDLTFVIDHNGGIGVIVLFIHPKQEIKHSVHFQFRTFFLKLLNLRTVHGKQRIFPSKLRETLNARFRCYKQIKARKATGSPIHKRKQRFCIAVYVFHIHGTDGRILRTNNGQAFCLNFSIDSKYISSVHILYPPVTLPVFSFILVFIQLAVIL